MLSEQKTAFYNVSQNAYFFPLFHVSDAIPYMFKSGKSQYIITWHVVLF